MTTFLNNYSTQIWAFILSMLPISEIRGAFIWGIPAGIDPLQLYIIGVIGNFLPVPFILWLFRPILGWLRRMKIFSRLATWAENRTHKKASQLMKGTAIALCIFVAIPFPTTGAWTGSMIASFLNMRARYALPAILIGIMTAGVIMYLVMTGIWNLKFLFLI